LLERLTWDELLDWLALWEIDPWGETRRDVRAAVASLWERGATFDAVEIAYPHVDTGEDDDDVLALMDADRKLRDRKLELHEIDKYRDR
jgi:hypothetical protein